jgi:hypothetical protein
MHFAVRRMERRRAPILADLPEFPELAGVGPDKAASSSLRSH